MVLCLYLLWAAWLTAAALSVLQVRKLVGRFRREPPGQHRPNSPRAWVIIPFKGLDQDLRAALRSLCSQTYPDYRLILVVDSPDDPAYPVLQDELARDPSFRGRAEILISGPAGPHESQKIHNQLYALERVLPKLGPRDILAFADSDAVPGANWLNDLLVNAWDPTIGMTTGYRWLIPSAEGAGGTPGKGQGVSGQTPASNRGQSQIQNQKPKISLSSHLASILNSSVACIYRQRLTSRAWGGAMAMRAEVAQQGDLEGWLRGALTDDYQFTRLCWSLKKRVWFSPRCITPSPVDFDFRGLCEFIRRQYLITRIYIPGTYYAALSLLSLWVVGWFATIASLIWALSGGGLALSGGGARLPWWLPAGVLLAGEILHHLRAYYRRRAVQAAFPPEIAQRLKTTLRLDAWATPLWMTAHWLLILTALFGRHITWRGITYRLDGPQNIHRL